MFHGEDEEGGFGWRAEEEGTGEEAVEETSRDDTMLHYGLFGEERRGKESVEKKQTDRKSSWPHIEHLSVIIPVYIDLMCVCLRIHVRVCVNQTDRWSIRSVAAYPNTLKSSAQTAAISDILA